MQIGFASGATGREIEKLAPFRIALTYGGSILAILLGPGLHAFPVVMYANEKRLSFVTTVVSIVSVAFPTGTRINPAGAFPHAAGEEVALQFEMVPSELARIFPEIAAGLMVCSKVVLAGGIPVPQVLDSSLIVVNDTGRNEGPHAEPLCAYTLKPACMGAVIRYTPQ